MELINDQMREFVDISTEAGRNIEDVYREVSDAKSVELNPPSRLIVLTPRSAKSCIQTGVNPNHLMLREFEAFQDSAGDDDIQKMRHEAYEHRRQEHMRLVRAAKKRLIKGKVPCFSEALTLSASSDSDQLANSTMIDEERKKNQKNATETPGRN